MNKLEEQKKKNDISDILAEADEENERVRARSEERYSTKDLEKTRVVEEKTDEPGKVDKNTKTRDLNAETIELINKYSTREIKEEKSDTQELRDALARKLEDEKLKGYLNTNPGTAKKIDDLRTRICDADTLTDVYEGKSGKKKDPIDISDRFSDEDSVPQNDDFEQAEMFPLGDTLTIHEQESKTQYAEFDKDYQELGKKVVENGIPDSERDDGQLSFMADETDVAPINPEMDETEKNLRLAFDMMDDDTGSSDTRYTGRGMPKKKKAKTEMLLEYTNRTQNEEISGKLKKIRVSSAIRLILAAVMAALLCWMEFGNLFNRFLVTGNVNIGARLYMVIDLQLVFLCALMVLPSLVRGLKGILSLHLTAESMLVFSLFFDAVYTVVAVVRGPETDRLGLYGVTIALSVLCLAVSNLMVASKNERVFQTISTKRPKYVAERIEPSAKEAAEFERYLYDESELYTVKKTNFVDGFSERTVKRSRFDDLFHVLLPLILFAGVAVFAAMLILGKNISDAFRAFYALIAVSTPTVGFFMLPLPLFAANRKGNKCSAAFVGNAIAEEYASAAVLSFADTEVFPSNLVSVTGVKTYEGYRIDIIIPELAKAFSYLGGPLAKVLDRMVDGQFEHYVTARVIESDADGIHVAIDGKHFYLGKRNFMKKRRFDNATADPGDDQYEKNSGSVMYVGIGDHLVSKIYVRYHINPRFETLLKDLYRADLCLGVKTMDPNITTALINSSVKFQKCPVSVIKQDNPKEISEETERTSSGIVCNSSLHNFLRMFALCDRVRHVTKCNAIITIVSVALSFIAVAFLAVSDDLQALGALQATLFQLCWQIPVWLLSFSMI